MAAAGAVEAPVEVAAGASVVDAFLLQMPPQLFYRWPNKNAQAFDYDNKATLINTAVSSLGEQLQQRRKMKSPAGSTVHTTEQYNLLFQQHEYA